MTTRLTGTAGFFDFYVLVCYQSALTVHSLEGISFNRDSGKLQKNMWFWHLAGDRRRVGGRHVLGRQKV